MKYMKYLMRISFPEATSTLTFDSLKLLMGLRGSYWYESILSDNAANGFSYIIHNIANLDLCMKNVNLRSQ